MSLAQWMLPQWALPQWVLPQRASCSVCLARGRAEIEFGGQFWSHK